MKTRTISIYFAIACWLLATVVSGKTIQFVLSPAQDNPALYGIQRLEKALEDQGYTVKKSKLPDQSIGDVWVVFNQVTGANSFASFLDQLSVSFPTKPEGLTIQKGKWKNKDILVICGYDSRGLMYATLDVADRVTWNSDKTDPFGAVEDIQESPNVHERAISIYTMQRAYFEQRLYDQKYWQRYFDMMAENRFNSFVVIFGYENGGFLAPPYPYFFNVNEFPNVQLVGITPEAQKHNRESFQKMIDLAHGRGIDVVVGIWDHIYRGGVQGGGIPGKQKTPDKPQPGLVWGVTNENLSDYNKTALRKFLNVFPDIDGIQFRMHGESGLKRGEMRGFWQDIFSMIKHIRPDLRVDARAKNLPNVVIQDALETGINLRITTKYWMEQMGLPFHPTHVNEQNQHDRRHGYADLLQYPKRYDVHWRLWNGGTNRILLWGDPDYAQTFVKSTHLYGGSSFEVNEPLATKMLAQPHDQEPFDLLNTKYQYYDYEFERYWHFYQVFGRIGYNPDVNPDIWEKEFEQRFGKAAGNALMQGLHQASKVLPRIVTSAYRYRYFPTTRGWAEKMHMDDLPTFSTAEGSDIQQFASFREHALDVIDWRENPKISPLHTARWFKDNARGILSLVDKAEEITGYTSNREFVSTLTDLKIISYLALYYANRIPAAVYYNLYKETGDLFSLEDAISSEKKAIRAWSEIVNAAGDVYASDLMMGVRHLGLSGHWRDELTQLKKEYNQLLAEKKSVQQPNNPGLIHIPIRKISPDTALKIKATIFQDDPTALVFVREDNSDFKQIEMKEYKPYMYIADIPYRADTPLLQYYIHVKNASESKTFPSYGEKNPVNLLVTSDRSPPKVTHQPVKTTRPGQDLMISARVTDTAGVKWVRLRYRHVTQFEDYKILDMTSESGSSTYSATIPGDFIVSQWDLMYFIEVMDNNANGGLYPDLTTRIPYIIVELNR